MRRVTHRRRVKSCLLPIRYIIAFNIKEKHKTWAYFLSLYPCNRQYSIAIYALASPIASITIRIKLVTGIVVISLLFRIYCAGADIISIYNPNHRPANSGTNGVTMPYRALRIWIRPLLIRFSAPRGVALGIPASGTTLVHPWISCSRTRPGARRDNIEQQQD